MPAKSYPRQRTFRRLIAGIIAVLLIGMNAIALPAVADSEAAITTLTSQAESKLLALHPYWLALLHYRGSGDYKHSEIITPEFFLSEHGATNPAAELNATIAALFREPGTEPDKHAQCRFIARYQWLKKNLDWGSVEPPSVICKDFDQWSMQGQIQSLSLIFATGYLGNPASFYGHILLKFNAQLDFVSSRLLDQSLNYGAIVPDRENPVAYIFKGIFGGYDAGFSHSQFYRHNHNYAENELRDMWEYKLSLTPEEIEQLVAHSWELLGNNFTYYFINQNCAYHMSKLLELVLDEPLLPSRLPWSMPGSVFDSIITVERNGQPLVQEVTLIPSRQNRFYDSYFNLTKSQQQVIKKLIDNGVYLDEYDYQELAANQKIGVINTLFDYYEFRMVTEDRRDEFKQAKHKLLVERLKLPSEGTATKTTYKSAEPPHKGPLPNLIRFGLLHNSEFGDGMELRFRPTYFDSLSLDAGRLPNSTLTMFDVRTVYEHNHFWLRSLDFVNIETLNVSRAGLPGDGGLAWKLKFGLESQDLSCSDCLIFSIHGGLGKAFSLMQATVVYGMLEAQAQTEHEDSGTLAGTAWAGLISSPLDAWKTQLEIGYRAYANGSQDSARLIRWENRLGNQRNRDFRISYEEHIEREVQLAISFYW